jgi:hypothetical protein
LCGERGGKFLECVQDREADLRKQAGKLPLAFLDIWSGVSVHHAPVLFHRLQVVEFFVAYVALEDLPPAAPEESQHGTNWWCWF